MAIQKTSHVRTALYTAKKSQRSRRKVWRVIISAWATKVTCKAWRPQYHIAIPPDSTEIHIMHQHIAFLSKTSEKLDLEVE